MSPRCALGMYRNGNLILTRSYGDADLEHAVPNSDTTSFYLASMSKQFTAYATLLLVRDGRLRLDDDVRRYVPELPNPGVTITIRHLINHTSGVRDLYPLLSLADWPGAATNDERLTEHDFLTMLARQRWLNFMPGTDWVYSVTNYVLLSLVIQRVTGKSLRSFAAVSSAAGVRIQGARQLDTPHG